jgi:molecular chaperone GrpE
MVQEHSEGQVNAQNDQKIDGPAEGEQEDAVSESGSSAGAEPLAEQLEAAQAEIAALKDQALRGQAEAENTRRRAARDVENAHKFALEKFAADLLPVIDSLEKAVETAQAAADQGDDSAPAAIGEGVGLSLKLFYDVLGKAGITQINPVGEPFDPKLHEAMAMVENPDAEPNSVLEVMQRGYLLNGRLVRAAMVVVSKAPAG